MSKRACVLAEVLAAALMAVAAALLAGEAYGADDTLSLRLATWLSVPAAYDPVVAEVTVNRQKRGEFTLVRSADGDFYARAADLPALGLAESLAPRRTVQFQGEAHVSLKSLLPQRLAFDDKRLALEVDFPAEALRGRSFDLTPPRPGIAQGRPDSGAFLNYRLSASDGAAGEPQRYGLAHELAARFDGVLLRNEAAFVSEGAATRGLRYNTQLVYDRPQDQQRYIVGDQTAASGELGSTAAIGGIGLAKHYPLTPNVVRQPLAGYAGAVSTPSLVEVRMGGVPVFREQVPAGPFELRNLQQYAGARDVEVVVRDALGREQTIGFPYYFADQALRQGLHEYSYSAGALRENLGVSNGDYGAGVFSAFHRYGLNDRVTLGGRGEAASGLKNFGPTALYRDDRLGAFSAAYSLSERDGQDGRASSLGHVYQSAGFGTHLNARRYSERYAVAQDLVAPLGLKAERLAGGSLALPRAGTLFLDRTITERWALPAQQATRLGYSYSMGRRGSLFATFTRTHQTSTQNQLFVGLLLTLDPAKTLHLSARRDASGNESLGAQFSSAVPAGEGLGYRLGTDGIGGGDTRNLFGFAQYNGRIASLTVDAARTRSSGDGVDRAEVAVAGAATWIDGRVGLTRQIEDSAVAVQLGAPLEGVRVYSNNQEVGRTDRDGRLLVPRVGSYYETQISIDEADIPLDHTLGAMRQVVAPPYRSASLVRFDVRRLHAVEGVLLVRSGARLVPAENAAVRVGALEFTTGRGGRYYVEELAPGRHEARLGNCRFFLEVPKSIEPLTTLPAVVACE